MIILELLPFFLVVFVLGLVASSSYYKRKFSPKALTRVQVLKEGIENRDINLAPGDSIVVKTSSGEPAIILKRDKLGKDRFSLTITKQLDIVTKDPNRVVEI